MKSVSYEVSKFELDLFVAPFFRFFFSQGVSFLRLQSHTVGSNDQFQPSYPSFEPFFKANVSSGHIPLAESLENVIADLARGGKKNEDKECGGTLIGKGGDG